MTAQIYLELELFNAGSIPAEFWIIYTFAGGLQRNSLAVDLNGKFLAISATSASENSRSGLAEAVFGVIPLTERKLVTIEVRIAKLTF